MRYICICYRFYILSQNYNHVEHTLSLSASYEISEAALLRDIIYIFQGIEGKVIKFDQANDAYRIDPKLGVPKPVRELVHKVAELGWLYRKIRKYLDAHAGVCMEFLHLYTIEPLKIPNMLKTLCVQCVNSVKRLSLQGRFVMGFVN